MNNPLITLVQLCSRGKRLNSMLNHRGRIFWSKYDRESSYNHLEQSEALLQNPNSNVYIVFICNIAVSWWATAYSKILDTNDRLGKNLQLLNYTAESQFNFFIMGWILAFAYKDEYNHSFSIYQTFDREIQFGRLMCVCVQTLNDVCDWCV